MGGHPTAPCQESTPAPPLAWVAEVELLTPGRLFRLHPLAIVPERWGTFTFPGRGVPLHPVYVVGV